MKRSRRIALLASLRQKQELDAAVALARLGDTERRQGELLDQVRQFDQEYRAGLAEALSEGISGQRLDELRRMGSQTAHACEQQTQRATLAGQDTRRGLQVWQSARRQRRAFEELAAGFQRAEARRAARREQDELDDRSQR